MHKGQPNNDTKETVLKNRNKLIDKVLEALQEPGVISFNELKKTTKLSDYKLLQGLTIAWSLGLTNPMDSETNEDINFGKVRKSKYRESDLKISKMNRFKAEYLFMFIKCYPGCDYHELKILAELDDKNLDKCLSWLNILGRIYIDSDGFIFSAELCEKN